MGSKRCDANNKSIGPLIVDADYHCYMMKFLAGISSWLHADSVSYFLLWRSYCKRVCEMLPHSHAVSVCVKRLVIEQALLTWKISHIQKPSERGTQESWLATTRSWTSWGMGARQWTRKLDRQYVKEKRHNGVHWHSYKQGYADRTIYTEGGKTRHSRGT